MCVELHCLFTPTPFFRDILLLRDLVPKCVDEWVGILCHILHSIFWSSVNVNSFSEVVSFNVQEHTRHVNIKWEGSESPIFFLIAGLLLPKWMSKQNLTNFHSFKSNTTITIFTCVSPFIRQQDFRLDAFLNWKGLYIFMRPYSFYFQYRIKIPNPWIKALQYVGRHVGRYYICVM